ncbi:MAG: hypothetical protein KJ638_04750 [Chloroflexi bacterium]|nr:hypothetical protein [Chloroflexota bacterium]
MPWQQRFASLKSAPWIAEGLAFLGGMLYLTQSWIYAHTQSSSLDEGAYLLKGYLFATGRYYPFQDYGPWTNHMPLSFLIPGWVQVLFGPGLRTGRYLAVALGVCMLVGVWILARQLGGHWWAAALIWLLALNIPLIKIYSVMASQGLVACMLVWILVLILGPNRPLWQLLLGTALAGLLLLTRVNLTPVLLFVLAYIFWEHKKTAGVWAVMIGIITVGAGHAFFWPGILKLWANWLPSSLMPFLNAWRSPVGAIPNWTPDIQGGGRLLSVLYGIRTHFFAVISPVTVWLLWPPRAKWQPAWRFRASVFLSSLFSILFALHLWASVGKDYCVFCFPSYLSFFAILGMLVVVVSFPLWQPDLGRGRKWITRVLVVSLPLGLAYSMTPAWGSVLISARSFRQLMSIELPRIQSFEIQPGKAVLWGLLANKFHWTEQDIFQAGPQIIRSGLLMFLGLLFGCLILRYGALWSQTFLKPMGGPSERLNTGTLIAFLACGVLLTLGMGLAPQERDCGWDVIASYEAGGAHLADQIQPGSKVYWNGGLSTVPLLYLDDIEIYPPQLNDGYSYRLGGEPDELVRYGWWSADLAQQWAQEADVILIEARSYDDRPDPAAFDEVPPTSPLLPCRTDSQIHIFIRNPLDK